MSAKIAAALVAAQADLRNPGKDKTANTGTYSYRYADLASILDLVRPILAKHGLAVLQDVRMEEGRLLIFTRLLHSSGESLEFGPLAGSVGSSWQQTGGGITYARRYALQAALGIAADEDDDAVSAPPPTSAKASLKAVKAKKASVEDIERWVDLIQAATKWMELKSIADEISAHEIDKTEREDLLALWTARKAEVVP